MWSFLLWTNALTDSFSGTECVSAPDFLTDTAHNPAFLS